MTSVDSSTKLWDITKTTCIMNYEGHVHHLYFVGMDSFDDLFCLGGGDSILYVSTIRRVRSTLHQLNYLTSPHMLVAVHGFVLSVTKKKRF